MGAILMGTNQQMCELNHQPMSWTYIAGFFDGEGHVDFCKTKMLTIVQVNKEVLHKIIEFIQFGRIYCVTHENPSLNRSECSEITIMRREQQVEFVKHILPFTIVKTKQLRQCLAFIESKQQRGIISAEHDLSNHNVDAPMSWGYITGFFDAEGWLTRNRYHYQIGMCQTALPVLRTIALFMGFGHIYRQKRRNVNWRRCYSLMILDHDQQKEFVTNVLSYAIVKAGALRECLSFIKNKEWNADKKLCNVDKHQLAKEYYEGSDLRTIAARYGVSMHTIQHHLRRLQVPMRPSHRPCSLDKTQLLFDWKSGIPVSVLAKKYGLTRAGIYRDLWSIIGHKVKRN